MPLSVTSPAFTSDQRIPARYTKEGANVSPPLTWRGVPRNTRSFALVVEDPDAARKHRKGTFHHWVVYNIPAEYRDLQENAGSAQAGDSLDMGLNDLGKRQYDGPQPPRGDGLHHYHFRLLALYVPTLGVRAGASVRDVLEAVRPNTIEKADVVGTFKR